MVGIKSFLTRIGFQIKYWLSAWLHIRSNFDLICFRKTSGYLLDANNIPMIAKDIYILLIGGILVDYEMSSSYMFPFLDG
jgi:hypothetical protein